MLVAGGRQQRLVCASAELYDPQRDWTRHRQPQHRALIHTATLLPNGKVLVAGGSNGILYLASAELDDPATGTWSATTCLATALVYGHTATLLPNGRVLVADDNAELYDPANGTWAATGSLGAARLWHTATLLPNGNVLVAGGNGGGGILASAELYLEPATTPSQPMNISTRMEVLTDDQALIGGFIITGTAPKRIILRAVGPSLAAFGISNPLADPVLELHGSDGSLITSNDNWKDTQQAEIEATGILPQSDLEPAIISTLDPGNYTAVVSGKGGGTGVGLVEAYDLDQAADSQLANISARGFVETGSNVMIGGFILGGVGGNASVVVRALGPSLTQFGVSGALADPTLELHDGNGALVRSNDNWKRPRTIEGAAGQPCRQPRVGDPEATLAPGAYTAIVRGAVGSTGVGLVEIYRLP